MILRIQEKRQNFLFKTMKLISIVDVHFKFFCRSFVMVREQLEMIHPGRRTFEQKLNENFIQKSNQNERKQMPLKMNEVPLEID